ncbi:MAG: EpsG family protein [Huintestinicola sp.]
MAIYWLLLAACAAVGIAMCFVGKKYARAGEGKNFGITLSDNTSPRLRTACMSHWSGITFCILMGTVFTVIASLRLGVGHDYNLYATKIYEMNFLDFDSVAELRWEKGIVYPLKVIGIATEHYIPGIVFISMVIYPMLMIFTAKYSECPWMGVFGFLVTGAFFNSLNFMRQFIAAVICAYALIYCVRRRFIRYAVLILIAAVFHRSALIMLPFYYILRLKWNVPVISAAAAVTITLMFTIRTIMQFAVGFVYKGYSVDSPDIIGGVTPAAAVIFAVIFISAMLLRKNMDGHEAEINMLTGSAFFMLFFELLGLRSALISRLGLYFIVPVSVMLIPRMYSALCRVLIAKTGSVRSGEMISLLIFFLAGAASYGMLLFINYNGVVPYETIFELWGE